MRILQWYYKLYMYIYYMILGSSMTWPNYNNLMIWWSTSMTLKLWTPTSGKCGSSGYHACEHYTGEETHTKPDGMSMDQTGRWFSSTNPAPVGLQVPFGSRNQGLRFPGIPKTHNLSTQMTHAPLPRPSSDRGLENQNVRIPVSYCIGTLLVNC